jgi:hypothetical protein
MEKEDGMRRTERAGWTLAAVAGIGAASAVAQQGGGPVVLPKPKPTILVVCDLACNWTLDYEAKGALDEGGSKKVTVSLGEHQVGATTQDGLDKFELEVDLKSAAQTIVRLELRSVRDARLQSDREARDRAAQLARDQAAAERQRLQQEASPTWTDPATGLMWTKQDYGSDITWPQAMSYCQNLQMAGYSDWMLPTIDELQGIYDTSVSVPGTGILGSYTFHVKGNLQLTGWDWSSSQGNLSGTAWDFNFGNGERYSERFGFSNDARALCVRRSGG